MFKEKLNTYKDDIIFISILLVMSLGLYLTHFMIFSDSHHIFLFGLSDFAFVPIEVIFVSLILHRVISSNDKKKNVKKVYMMIEVFFSGMGFDVLRILAGNDLRIEEVQDDFIIGENWKKRVFKKRLKSYKPDLDLSPENFQEILDIIEKEKDVMQRMIENPMLLEHDTFSELLMAVFHFYKELSLRIDLGNLSKLDKKHLVGDAQRVYIFLCVEWIEYLNHMRVHYPYMYNLSMRVDPYGEEAHVEVD